MKIQKNKGICTIDLVDRQSLYPRIPLRKANVFEATRRLYPQKLLYPKEINTNETFIIYLNSRNKVS